MNNKVHCKTNTLMNRERKFFQRGYRTDPKDNSSVLSVDDLSISADENALPTNMEKDGMVKPKSSVLRQPNFTTTLQPLKHPSTQNNLEAKQVGNNKYKGFGMTSTPIHSSVPLRQKFIDEQLSPIVQERTNASRSLHSRIPVPQNRISCHFIGETVSQRRKPLSPLFKQNKRASDTPKNMGRPSKVSLESCFIQISKVQHTSVVSDSNKVLEMQTCRQKMTFQGNCYSRVQRNQVDSNYPKSVPVEEVLSQGKDPITRKVCSNIEVHGPKKTNDGNMRRSSFKVLQEKEPQISKSIGNQLHSDVCIQQGTQLLNEHKEINQKLEKTNSKFEQHVTDNKLNCQQLPNISANKSQQLAGDRSKSILKKSVFTFDICEDEDDDIFGVSRFTKHKISSISGTTGAGDNKDLVSVDEKELPNEEPNGATRCNNRKNEKQNIRNKMTNVKNNLVTSKALTKESGEIEVKRVTEGLKSFRGKKKVSFIEDESKNQDVINSKNIMLQNIESSILNADCLSSRKVTKTTTKPRTRSKIIKTQISNNVKSDFNIKFEENAQNTSSVCLNKFKNLKVNKNTGNEQSNQKLTAEGTELNNFVIPNDLKKTKRTKQNIASQDVNLDQVAVHENDCNTLKQDIPKKIHPKPQNKVNAAKSASKGKEIESIEHVGTVKEIEPIEHVDTGNNGKVFAEVTELNNLVIPNDLKKTKRTKQKITSQDVNLAQVAVHEKDCNALKQDVPKKVHPKPQNKINAAKSASKGKEIESIEHVGTVKEIEPIEHVDTVKETTEYVCTGNNGKVFAEGTELNNLVIPNDLKKTKRTKQKITSQDVNLAQVAVHEKDCNALKQDVPKKVHPKPQNKINAAKSASKGKEIESIEHVGTVKEIEPIEHVDTVKETTEYVCTGNNGKVFAEGTELNNLVIPNDLKKTKRTKQKITSQDVNLDQVAVHEKDCNALKQDVPKKVYPKPQNKINAAKSASKGKEIESIEHVGTVKEIEPIEHVDTVKETTEYVCTGNNGKVFAEGTELNNLALPNDLKKTKRTKQKITSQDVNLDQVAVHEKDCNALKQDFPKKVRPKPQNKINAAKSASKGKEIESIEHVGTVKEIEPIEHVDTVKETIEYVVGLAYFEYSDEQKSDSLPVENQKLLSQSKAVKRRLQEHKLELSTKRIKKEEALIQLGRKRKVLESGDEEKSNSAGSSQDARRSGRKRSNVKEYWIDSSNSEKSNEPENHMCETSKRGSNKTEKKIPSHRKRSASLVQMPQGYSIDKMPCFSSLSPQFKVIQPGVGKATGIIVNKISTGGHICIQRDETFNHVSNNNIMYMVQKGSAVVEINRTLKAVELNSFFFVPCNVPYKVKNQGRGRMILCYVKTLPNN